MKFSSKDFLLYIFKHFTLYESLPAIGNSTQNSAVKKSQGVTSLEVQGPTGWSSELD